MPPKRKRTPDKGAPSTHRMETRLTKKLRTAAESIDSKGATPAQKQKINRIKSDDSLPSSSTKPGDTKAGWKPNSTYAAKGPTGETITYRTDAHGRVVSAKGKLKLNSSKHRDSEGQAQQRVSGGADRVGGGYPKRDDGGHLIGHQLGGTEYGINIVPQNSRLNEHGAWRDMERHWAKELRDGKDVQVEVQPGYHPGNKTERPDFFNVEETIDGAKKSRFFKNDDSDQKFEP